jgi:predicted NBD/HSP70 family sugar kinase
VSSASTSGGTKLLAGVVASGLDVHHRAYRLAPASGLRDVLEAVTAVVDEARDAAGGEIRAVGFGIPSLFDRERGIAVSTVHLPIRDVPFRDLMAERLGLPVFVDNDANAAMLAEHRFGAARGAEHALLLTLGTGIGGGVVVAGEILRERSGRQASSATWSSTWTGRRARATARTAAASRPSRAARRSAAPAWPSRTSSRRARSGGRSPRAGR